jgi:glycosyltransferase involved in cell wall biosynthesis
MKIAFHIESLSISGGTERVTSVLANALVRRGVQVDIICVHAGKPFFDLDPGVGVVHLNPEGESNFWRDYARNVRRLRRVLRRNGYDYLVDVKPHRSVVSIPAALGLKTKIVSTEHSNLHVGGISADIGRLMAIHLGYRMVVLTDADKEAYERKFGGNNIVRIFNPVTIETGDKPSALNELRFVALGRICDTKGFDMLLDAWALAGCRHRAWKLRIAGSGDAGALRAQAERLGIEGSVEILPAVKDVRSMYGEASVYVLSSRFEGFGLVLTEAAAMGLPAVSFDCDYGPREIIVHGETGILVPPEDIAALAAAMDDMAADEMKRKRMGHAALERSRLFSLNTIADQWIDLFK